MCAVVAAAGLAVAGPVASSSPREREAVGLELARAVRESEDPGVSPTARAAALAESVDLRRRMIAITPTGIMKLRLMIEQVEGLLRVTGAGGADLFVLVGAASAEERAVVRERMGELLEVCGSASAQVTEVVEGADRASAFGQQAGVRESDRIEAINWRSVVMPLRRARAEVLLGAIAEAPGERARAAGRAVVILEGLGVDGAAARAERAVLLGHAMLLSGEWRAARVSMQAALEVVEGEEGGGGALAYTGAEARLGLILAVLAERGPARAREEFGRLLRDHPAFRMDDGGDPLLQVVACCVRYAIERRAALEAGDEADRRAAWVDAVRMFLALMSSAEVWGHGAAVGAEAMRRVGLLCDDRVPLDSLDARVSVAYARRLVKQEGESERAIGVLRRALERPAGEDDDAAGAGRYEAVWMLAGLMAQRPEEEARIEAVERFVEAADVLAGRGAAEMERAGVAVDAACAVAAALLQTGVRSERGMSAVLVALRRAHRDGEMVERVGTWRYLLGRLLREEALGATATHVMALREEADEVLAASGAHADDRACWRVRVWRDALDEAESGEIGIGEGGVVAQRLAAAADTAAGMGGACEVEAVVSRARALAWLGEHEAALEALGAMPEARGAGDADEWRVWCAEGEAVRVRSLLSMGRVKDVAAAMEEASRTLGRDARGAVEAGARGAWDGVWGEGRVFVEGGRVPGAGDAAVVLRAASMWAQRHASPASERYERWLGWSLLLDGDTAGALRVLEKHAASHGRTVDAMHPMAEAKLRLGEDEAAFALWREIVAIKEERGVYDTVYRAGWVRMLEVLARHNADGSRSETIRREAVRLRGLPGTMDDAEALRRLEGVARGL